MVLTREARPPLRTLKFGPARRVEGRLSDADGRCLCPMLATGRGGPAGPTVCVGPAKQGSLSVWSLPGGQWPARARSGLRVLLEPGPQRTGSAASCAVPGCRGPPHAGPCSFPVQELGECGVLPGHKKCPVSLESRVQERTVEVTQRCLAGHQEGCRGSSPAAAPEGRCPGEASGLRSGPRIHTDLAGLVPREATSSGSSCHHSTCL